MTIEELFDLFIDKGYNVEWYINTNQFRMRDERGISWVYVQITTKPGIFHVWKNWHDPILCSSVEEVVDAVSFLGVVRGL